MKPAPDSGKRPPGSAAAEPSWGRVLITTVKLSVLRRLGAVGRRWRLAALALVLVLAVGAVLRFTGVGTGTGAPGARVSAPHESSAGGTGSAGDGTSSPAAAAAARSRAAAWVAGQVSGNAIVACYPGMCAALQVRGVPAGRLLPLRPGTASPLGASLVVTSPPISSQLVDEYAPALVASFGSGANRIEVRAAEPGGAAAYRSELRADLAARRTAGSQLLRNEHIQFTAPDTARLGAGEVDSRLLATLAALASKYSFRVTRFGDTSPGAPPLFREVTITRAGRGDEAAGLAGALAMVRAQTLPYLPAHAAIVHLAGGRTALSIEFAAPSPLGLLTPVLDAGLQHAPTATTAIAGDFPRGRAQIR